MKLIPLDAVLAEIERRKQDAINNCGGFKSMREHECNSCIVEQYEEMKNIINTLEVKEVDLENLREELDKAVKIYKPNGDFGWGTLYNIAVHFFELGIKAKDWKKQRMEECPYRQVGCTMYEGKVLECKGACGWVVDYPKLKELKAQKEK